MVDLRNFISDISQSILILHLQRLLYTKRIGTGTQNDEVSKNFHKDFNTHPGVKEKISFQFRINV